MTQSKTEKVILEQCYRNRTPIPQAIMNAPDLQVGLSFYYNAFLDLTTCRVIGGMGSEGPITWLVIDQYCKANEIDGEQREDLFYHISKLDSAYMEHRLKEVKANAKKTGGKNGNSSTI